MNKEGLDFEVKNLADYSVEDLEALCDAVLLAHGHFTHYKSDEMKQRLDTWLYRIKDAISQARKRESENLNDN